MEKSTKGESLQRHESGQPERVQQRPTVAPRVDIFENEHEVLLIADLPGVDKGDLNINLDKDQLTLIGTRHAEARGTELGSEFRDVDFHRVFVIPAGIDSTKITADLKQGVLYLHLPKSEAVKPRHIAIRAG